MYVIYLLGSLLVLVLAALAVVTRQNFLLSKEIKHSKTQIDSLKRCQKQFGVWRDVTSKLGSFLNNRETVNALHQGVAKILPYSAVSMYYFDDNRLFFKTYTKDVLSKSFITKIRREMDLVLEENFHISSDSKHVEEVYMGKTLTDYGVSEVGSFINLPYKIEDNICGVLNIASDKPDMYDAEEVSEVKDLLVSATEVLTKVNFLVEHEKRKLSALVESMTEGVMLLDEKFGVQIVNPALKRHLKISQSSSVSIFDIVRICSEGVALEEIIDKVFKTKEVQVISELELKSLRKNFQVVVLPVQIDPKTSGVGILFHDRSKEAELNSLRDDYTAMTIHELRSPLTVIKGTSNIILREAKNLSKEQIDNFLKQIEISSSDLLDIVNDLLDAAKIESGKLVIIKKPEDLNKLLDEELSYYINLANNKGLELKVKNKSKIPIFEFDYEKVRQVLNNLLSNAIKFTESGGQVLIESRVEDNRVVVSVADTGIGISGDAKSKLFNKFVQLEGATKSGTKGTGLGLTISKGIVEAHEGNIWIEDNEPSGAKFVFSLPM